ncbi:MAG: hypothetical protein ACUVT7_00985 [Thermoplasmata archaeon]
MEASRSRTCVRCGRAIAWDVNVCSYCGHDYRIVMAPPQPREEISSGTRILLYLIAFFIPLAGFIIGVIYYMRPEPAYKHVGKMCILIALLPILIMLMCVFVAGVAFFAFG